MARVARRQLRERSRAKVGIVGLAAVALVMALALNLSTLRSALGSEKYTAEFAEGGGVRSGDDVRVRGLRVGSVDEVRLGEKGVEVTFSAEGVTLGDRTEVAVKSANALGRKFLAVTPAGSGSDSMIPTSRTDAGYSVNTVLGELSTTARELDVDQVATSFESLTTILDRTPEEFREALSGVTELSRTISERDESLATLLERSSSVSQVLADRNEEITAIMSDGSALLGELQRRREVVRALLRNVQAATDELEGLARDNAETLKPALEQLRTAAAIFAENRDSLEFAITNLAPFIRSLGEAVGSGPFFQAYLQNLGATNLVPILPSILGDLEGES